MKLKHVLSLLAAPLVIASLTPRVHAQDASSVTCADGTSSTAKGRGACSRHGGVKKDSSEADSSATASSAPSAATPTSRVSRPETEAAAASGTGGSTCKDGTTSAKSGRGACSGHGGVVKSGDAGAAPVAAPMSAPAPTPARAAAAANSATTARSADTTATSDSAGRAPTIRASSSDPQGATAKCKDGTYSHSVHHTGACSHHGGVSDWLTK